MFLSHRVITLTLSCCLLAAAQQPATSTAKERARYARDVAKSGGSESIPNLLPLLSDPERDVRVEAVKAIVTIGTQHSVDPLIRATRDNDPEVQMRATDGIVNFYMPGYVQSGLQKFGTAVRSRFDREDTRAIDPFVTVRPEAVEALGNLVRGGVGMEVRANAARAVGILRGKAAVPDLVEALRTKNDDVLFESLIALQKIGDQSAGPKVIFLMRDLEDRVQAAAIDTVALLRTREAVPDLQRVYKEGRSAKAKRSSLSALAMLPDESSRPLFEAAFDDKDEALRAASAEGLGRLRNKADHDRLQKAFGEERKMAPRLAQAFALVNLGHTDAGEFAPVMYLVNTLNSKSYRNVAQPYLIELAREPKIREELYRLIKNGTREEKMGIARVLGVSGTRESVEHLQALTKDPDVEVAQEALRASRALQARLH